MDDSNTQVLLHGYGLKLKSSTRSRTGLLCKTDKGTKELRKIKADESMLVFDFEARRHLKNKGFANVECYNETIDEKPYFHFDETNYVLLDYKPYKNPDFSKKENILAAVSSLAKMHIASEGFISNCGNSNLGKIPVRYEKRKSELLYAMKWIKKQSSLSKVDLMVLKNFYYYKDRTDTAIDRLEMSGYSDIIKSIEPKKGFCHNSFKPDNIKIFDNTNDFCITGFGKCAYDYFIVDIAEIIRRMMKNGDVMINDIYEILETYDNIKTISKKDKEILAAMLIYPNKFLKTLNQHYNKRRVYVSESIIQKMERCIDAKKREDEILNELVL